MISLTGCEGCYFGVLDLREKFLKLAEKIELKNFRLFEEDKHLPNEKYDIAFVEGSPLTTANIEKLKQFRKNSKVLVAFGSCAHMGGIYHLKQYQDKVKLHAHVYDADDTIENIDVKPIAEYVKVDLTVPGCPVNEYEFLDVAYKILINKTPKIKQNPVCYECQVQGYECVLQKGEVCMGPITLGGCEAICLKSKQGCWGCRGLVEDAGIGNLLKKLKENHSKTEIEEYFEVFGVEKAIKEAREGSRR